MHFRPVLLNIARRALPPQLHATHALLSQWHVQTTGRTGAGRRMRMHHPNHTTHVRTSTSPPAAGLSVQVGECACAVCATVTPAPGTLLGLRSLALPVPLLVQFHLVLLPHTHVHHGNHNTITTRRCRPRHVHCGGRSCPEGYPSSPWSREHQGNLQGGELQKEAPLSRHVGIAPSRQL